VSKVRLFKRIKQLWLRKVRRHRCKDCEPHVAYSPRFKGKVCVLSLTGHPRMRDLCPKGSTTPDETLPAA
jgi:hypothetical protein